MKNPISLININGDLNKKVVNQIKKKNNGKLKFIGPWCKNEVNYFKENFKDTLVLKSQFKLNKYKKDVDFLIHKYEFTLNFLTKKLNKIHKLNYQKKYWEVILGRWLMTWINHNFFIWDYVNRINKEFNIKKLYQSEISLRDIIPLNTLDSHFKCKLDDNWCQWTFEKVIKYKNKKNILKYVHSKKNKKILNHLDINSYMPQLIFLKKSKKIFFYQLELDKKIKIKLFKKYRFIFFQSKKKISFDEKKTDKRKEFHWNYDKSKIRCSFQNFLLSNLIYSIPKTFLEYFTQLKFYNEKINWPKNSKYVLTSYAQYYDEFFKMYCADRRVNDKSFRLCVTQHGYGNFFEKNDFYNSYQDRKISDIYLTWGNFKKFKGRPFFYTKFDKDLNNEFKVDNNKKILFLSYSFSSGLHYPVDAFENGNIINKNSLIKIDKFIKNVKNNLNKKILFKNLNINKINNFEKSLKYKIPSIKFINKKSKFLDIINNYNISIHHFLGTPFFECLAINKPSIVLFDDKMHFPFDNNFRKFIKEFEKLDIFFRDEKKAAQFLNKNYGRIDVWWNNKNLQKTIKKFCRLYCYKANNPMKIIKNTFD